MLKDNWLEKQLKTTRELIADGAAAVADNRLVDAEDKLSEASVVLASALTITDDVLMLRITVFSELAMIATRTSDTATALSNYRKAMEAADTLAERGEHLVRMERGTILVNVGGIHAATGRVEDGVEASLLAVTLFDELGDEPNVPLMRTFALYHLGACYLGQGSLEEGAKTLHRAAADGRVLAEAGESDVEPILVEILTHLARALANTLDAQGAWTIGAEATQRAMALYEASGQDENLAQYLQSELDVVSYAELAGRFDDAEDSFFKVLDLAGDNPDVISRGMKFYDSLLSHSDDELVAGGLPREEVEESRRELLARAATLTL
jgi:tetratricopeptide (TPR) repeat protein